MNDEDKLLWNRAFDKFDNIDRKVTDLCIKTAANTTKIDNHLKAQEKKGARKEKIFYIFIAGMASIFSFFTFIREQV